MIKTVTRMVAATAAFGLVATPIVAQANTRASDSAAVYSVSNVGVGLGRSDEGESIVGAFLPVIIVITTVTAVVAGALVAGGVIGDDGDEDGDGSAGA